MPIEKFLFRVHFCFLYLLMYSLFRNASRMPELSDNLASFLRYLTFGFAIWYTLFSLYLFLKDRPVKWDKSDYLSPIVLVITVILIIMLEYFVY